MTTGRQGDADAVIETHTRAIMCIEVEDDALAWYVGRGLTHAMGLDASEWAEPFDSQSYEYRRSEWWE